MASGTGGRPRFTSSVDSETFANRVRFRARMSEPMGFCPLPPHPAPAPPRSHPTPLPPRSHPTLPPALPPPRSPRPALPPPRSPPRNHDDVTSTLPWPPRCHIVVAAPGARSGAGQDLRDARCVRCAAGSGGRRRSGATRRLAPGRAPARRDLRDTPQACGPWPRPSGPMCHRPRWVRTGRAGSVSRVFRVRCRIVTC
jgi:hypothetical protein